MDKSTHEHCHYNSRLQGVNTFSNKYELIPITLYSKIFENAFSHVVSVSLPQIQWHLLKWAPQTPMVMKLAPP